MNKGTSFYFGYVFKDIEEQVKLIKDAGLDCVMASTDPSMKKENGTLKKQVKLFNKYNLKLSSLHSRYRRRELPHFWCEDKIGNKIEKNLIKDVKLAHKYGFTCLVVHVKGEANSIGFERLKRVLKVCEKLNIPLALENLSNNEKTLKDIFKRIKSKYLKFCWDVGHNNAFTPDVDFINTYKSKLIALHLHDNLGAHVTDEEYKKMDYTNIYPKDEGKVYNPDMHTLNKYGNINWEEVAKILSTVKQPLNLDYEVLMKYKKDETANDVLNEIYKQACELEAMIIKYKKQKN